MTLNDISLVSAYKYRNPEPGILPPKIKVSYPVLPLFESTKKIFISSIMFVSDVYQNIHGYKVDFPGTESFPPKKPLKDIPQIISDM